MNQLTVICPAALQDNANKVWRVFDKGNDGDKTFTQGYSADGSEPPTHYVACGWFSAAETNAMSTPPKAWNAISNLAANRNRDLPFTAAQFKNAWAQLQISAADADPRAFIGGAGLVPVVATEES